MASSSITVEHEAVTTDEAADEEGESETVLSLAQSLASPRFVEGHSLFVHLSVSSLRVSRLRSLPAHRAAINDESGAAVCRGWSVGRLIEWLADGDLE
jgi:hypothetical protein